MVGPSPLKSRRLIGPCLVHPRNFSVRSKEGFQEVTIIIFFVNPISHVFPINNLASIVFNLLSSLLKI